MTPFQNIILKKIKISEIISETASFFYYSRHPEPSLSELSEGNSYQGLEGEDAEINSS